MKKHVNRREILRKFMGKTSKFQCTFKHFGTRINPKNGKRNIKTMLITNIYDEHGNFVADHMWIDNKEGLNLHKGQRITFEGTARQYIKGYLGTKQKIGHRRQGHSKLGFDYELVPNKINKL